MNTQTDKPKKGAATYVPNVKLFADVRRVETLARDAREQSKANNAEVANEKITIYAQLAADIWDVPLHKGNMRPANRAVFYDALNTHGGISKGVANRYYQYTVGISRMRKVWDIPTQATANVIKQTLLDRDITTETKLREALAGAADDSDKGDPEVERIVARFVGKWTYRKTEEGERVPNLWKPGKMADKLDELLSSIERAQRVAEAAKQAAEAAENSEAEYEKVLALLDPDDEEDQPEAA